MTICEPGFFFCQEVKDIGIKLQLINKFKLEAESVYYSFSRREYFHLLLAPIEGFIALIG